MRYLSRKFVLTCLCQLGVFALVFLGKISGGEFVAASSLFAGAYVAANVAQKIKKGGQNDMVN